jgi:acetolactate decarboxylase
MRQGTRSWIFLCASLVFLLLGPASVQAGERLFQYSTIDALLAGVYDGNLTMGELLNHGGFGLGTFNTLDGEMVVVDGVAYHVTAGGKAVPAPNDAKTPFAAVTDFDEDTILRLAPAESMAAFNAELVKGLPSPNAFYAIRIDGRFPWVRTRAIPGQSRPYRPLAELVKEQVVVKYTNVQGTLVGLWSPAFVKGVNVPGFHWHFLTADRTAGGHVLDCAVGAVVAKVDQLLEFTVKLPAEGAFTGTDLTPDRSSELESVEKGSAQ